MAGANAALKVQGRDSFVLERDQAYIGVLIDDLVTKGVDEPYRLFTSRAEFRLLLRQDNACRRLGPVARTLGLLTQAQTGALDERLEREKGVKSWFQETALAPDVVNPLLEGAEAGSIREPVRAAELLKRPGVRASDLARAGEAPFSERDMEDALTAVEVEVKYAGYVDRELDRAGRLREQASFALPRGLPYREFITLSFEAREKLDRIQPGTLAQAGRIPGVSPADLQNLMMEVRRWRRKMGERKDGDG
jgi:tRNA uridine 5-carboxymethylaminomethyl modification enzyme